MAYRYVDENRIGDHICYYSDLRKMKAHYPGWGISKSLPDIFEEIAAHWMPAIALTWKALHRARIDTSFEICMELSMRAMSLLF